VDKVFTFREITEEEVLTLLPNMSMFADDTQIDTSSNNINSIANILNEDLRNVSDWMKAN
jgi:hypothetical protein